MPIATSWDWRDSLFNGIASTVTDIIQPIFRVYGLGPLIAGLFVAALALILWERMRG